MNRVDFLLKIIAAADGEAVTPAQLQKVAFRLGMEWTEYLPDDYYAFRKYDYGPFSAEIYRDAEQLERQGKITISINPRGGWKEYSVTRYELDADLEEIPEQVLLYIDETVRWARTLSFQGLVREVYRMYPEYRENSVFQD